MESNGTLQAAGYGLQATLLSSLANIANLPVFKCLQNRPVQKHARGANKPSPCSDVALPPATGYQLPAPSSRLPARSCPVVESVNIANLPVFKCLQSRPVQKTRAQGEQTFALTPGSRLPAPSSRLPPQALAALADIHSRAEHRPKASQPMKSLIVEDDFTSRLLLQTLLSRFGPCHVAVNGKEAVDAFRLTQKDGAPYDLICMDIMMPEMDGQEALHQIRKAEMAQGILSTSGVKVIMTTALDRPKDVFDSFFELCDDYLVKPIDAARLIETLSRLGLVA